MDAIRMKSWLRRSAMIMQAISATTPTVPSRCVSDDDNINNFVNDDVYE